MIDNALMLPGERMESKQLLPKEAAEALVSRRDVLVSLPTSFGKNFCYGCLSTAERGFSEHSNGEKHFLTIQ